MNNINSNNTNNQQIILKEEPIFISDIINDLEKIELEKNKDDFIKNYSKLKKQIEITDTILNIESTDNLNNYNTYNIKELFDILESNSEYILNPENLEISKLKLLLNVSKILEEKLNNNKLDIIEIQ